MSHSFLWLLWLLKSRLFSLENIEKYEYKEAENPPNHILTTVKNSVYYFFKKIHITESVENIEKPEEVI